MVLSRRPAEARVFKREASKGGHFQSAPKDKFGDRKKRVKVRKARGMSVYQMGQTVSHLPVPHAGTSIATV